MTRDAEVLGGSGGSQLQRDIQPFRHCSQPIPHQPVSGFYIQIVRQTAHPFLKLSQPVHRQQRAGEAKETLRTAVIGVLKKPGKDFHPDFLLCDEGSDPLSPDLIKIGKNPLMGDKRIIARLLRFEAFAGVILAAGTNFKPPFSDTAGDEAAGWMLIAEILPVAARTGRRAAGMEAGAEAAIDPAAADGGVVFHVVTSFLQLNSSKPVKRPYHDLQSIFLDEFLLPEGDYLSLRKIEKTHCFAQSVQFPIHIVGRQLVTDLD